MPGYRTGAHQLLFSASDLRIRLVPDDMTRSPKRQSHHPCKQIHLSALTSRFVDNSVQSLVNLVPRLVVGHSLELENHAVTRFSEAKYDFRM